MDKWVYMIARSGEQGWNVEGDEPNAYEGAQSLYQVLQTAGERGWELVALPGNLADSIVFKRPAKRPVRVLQ